MEILWLAIILYSAGLALVLHFRPTLMFNDDGTWKEFGYQRSSRHTLLPFWLFVVAWAFVSYAAAAALSWTWFSWFSWFSWFDRSVALASASASALPSYWSAETDEEDEDDDDDDELTPVSSSAPQPLTSSDGVIMPPRRGPGRPRKDGTEVRSRETKETRETRETRPGYYIREDTPTEGGLYRYIYYGPDAPATAGQDAAIRLPNATP